ncbi:DUF6191 domain-containing protein [Streptomyces sp. NPDC008317]|uniref:DUF6191 domain-containing protein n=1 Tax=unclassified Streptomyces TaxID=2593676 RepID=UPI0036EA2877
MFNFMDELFAPGRKHTEDERNRLELSRDDEGSSDPARGAIDLDSGSVVIRPAHADAHVTEATPSESAPAGEPAVDADEE